MSNKFWMGAEDTYEAAMAALAKYENYAVANPKACTDEEDPDESPYLQVVDGVGVVSVQGSLMDGEYGIVGSWFGITGYGDIQKALVSAVRNADVRSILLVVKSGGGAVAGVSETAKLIQSVDKIKPVVTYSPSTMASAALWLGLAAREAHISETAIAGSIGTLTVMVSRHRMLQQDGIDAEVIRSGKFKSLGHAAEPMSDLAKEETQKTIDYLADIFLGFVADRRGVNKIAADTKFGQGRTFVGAQAAAVGLVDGVSSYSQAFLAAKAKAVPDNSRQVLGASIAATTAAVDNAAQPKGNSMHVPSDAELAAMAAGIDINAESSNTATQPPQGPASTDAEDLNAKLTAAEQAKADAVAALATATAEAETLKTSLSAVQAELTALKDVNNSMSDIVRASVKTMALPFNLDTGALADLNGADLLAKHKEVSDLFKSKVKAGGVAATARQSKEEADQQTQTAAVNPLFLAAAQLNSRNKGK